MNIALWIGQSLLALVMLMSGGMKVTSKTEALQQRMDYLPAPVMRLLGVLEVLGAIGLILPGLLGIYPQLTGIAAGAFVLVFAGASGIHLARKEQSVAGVTVLFLAIAVFTVLGRWFLAPL